MPFALVIIGLIMIVTGAKGTQSALGRQLVSDFTGPGNFFYWFASIGAVGALGAIPEFKNFSRMFMTLILVAMVIRNGGVFDKLLEAIEKGPVAPSTGANDNNAASGVMQGAANLQSSSAAAVAGVAEFARNSQQPSSNPMTNFMRVANTAGKIFGLGF